MLGSPTKSQIKPRPSLNWVKSRIEELGYAPLSSRFSLLALRDASRPFNQWSDWIGCVVSGQLMWLFQGTTLPGRFYMVSKLLNPKGCAILLPGQYLGVYRLGLHKGKSPAFVQCGEFQVARDWNRNEVYDFTRIEEASSIGLNIHTTTGLFPVVNKFSAGCLVVQRPWEFKQLLDLAECSKQDFFDLTLMEF